ncbi:MAG: phosphate ABC transporter permease subunit PstC [Candidatus Muiribacteriaceae bacterium]
MQKIKGLKREKAFYKAIYFSGLLIVLLVIAIFITLFIRSLPAIRHSGAGFVFAKEWDPNSKIFGIAPFIAGTLITSFLALIICLPFSLAISILLGEYFRTGRFAGFIKSMVEIMAGVPSVSYGFWGLYVLIPLVQKLEIKFGIIPPYGAGILTASLILAVMIIPYAASLGRESIELVPSDIKEAAYSLGSTRFEVVRKIVLPYSASGIIAGIILSLGRALGETMAVTMVIGNAPYFPESIFSLGNTLSSLIANEFVESDTQLHQSALIYAGLILFVITAIVNMAGRMVTGKLAMKGGNNA